VRLLLDKNAVLINTKQRRKLLKTVPTAKPVVVDGRQLVAVPYRLEEVKVLNNLGLQVPSPIVHKYDWPREKTMIPKPFDAQRWTAGMLTLNSRAFVLNALGTGKSLAALWAYDYLRRRGLAGKLLVLCPLSTTDRTWGDELFFHLRHLKAVVLTGTRAKRLKMLAEDADVYIINHHGAQIIDQALRERPDITHVILDEVSQVARNRSTDMWASLNHIINGAGKKSQRIWRACWAMTATPIPNEPTDAWAQVRLVNPSMATGFFTAFRERVMQQYGPHTWVPRKNALEIVDQIMVPSVRFRREDCVDLPPTIYITREVQMSPEQSKAYKSMFDDLSVQMAQGHILAVNEAVKVGKLVQIACGVAYDRNGNEITLGAPNRIKQTIEAIEESDSKTIVFVPFVSSVNYVAEELRLKGYTVGVIHGGVSKKQRDVVFQAFQNSIAPRVIVAQPAAMSHGLTLTKASTIVWYAPVTSSDTYEQANGRITRPGQKYTQVIMNIEASPIERRIYARLKKKQAMQNLLLERKTTREAA
jgi:SNF2 family DNA or RNA helicase